MPSWMWPEYITGIPPQTAAESGDRCSVPSGWADVQQREKGGGGATRVSRVPRPGSPHRWHCTASWPWKEGSAAGWALSAPAAWAGTGALGSESSPGGGARLEPSFLSFDCNQTEGFFFFLIFSFCHY